MPTIDLPDHSLPQSSRPSGGPSRRKGILAPAAGPLRATLARLDAAAQPAPPPKTSPAAKVDKRARR